MIDFLLNRTTIITLAVIGGLISLLFSWCKSNNKLTEDKLKLLNKTAYVITGISIVLFIAAGLFGLGQDPK